MSTSFCLTVRDRKRNAMDRLTHQHDGLNRLAKLGGLTLLCMTLASAVSNPAYAQEGSIAGESALGDAFQDERNPIRVLFGRERLDLWSLKPMTQPASASIMARDVAHPIDSWIHHSLQQAQLSNAPRADQRTLIRRVTFNLSGLPPTPDEVESFCDDDAPDAYERLADRLFASPRYGERFARGWLDVVRYADTNGYERDEFRPLAWQYRDYVVRAFNADKPYDRFVKEQLAGDELVDSPPATPEDADALIATGYLRLGQWDSTASIFQEEQRLRAEILADLTNTTASAFLGLTMSCCQCHDHKYDPLSHVDHYRLRAFFAGVTERDDLVITLADEHGELSQHNASLDAQITTLQEKQAKLDKDADKDKTTYQELADQIAALETQKQKPAVAMGATDAGASAPAVHRFDQGDFHSPLEEVPPGFVSLLEPQPATITAPRENTTGRRLALANWIASPDNRWTARVMVNRLWQHHFGVGIVATPNDFGYSGARPTHPELLDALAIQFTQHAWSIKHLQRAIVLSETYRQSSLDHPDAANAVRVDPHNHLLGRQSIRRLDAETVRDSLLAVSGRMQSYPSGKPRWPDVPKELIQAQPAILEAEKGDDGGRMQGWYTDPIDHTDVRSLFLIRKRSLPVPFLQAFDLPDTTVSCARRDTTVVAPQALMLLNSPEGIRYAEALADRLHGECEESALRIHRLFQLALARSPSDDEQSQCTMMLKRHIDLHGGTGNGPQSERLAWIDLCRAILNLNEFLYID